jgi:hypothetical protein
MNAINCNVFTSLEIGRLDAAPSPPIRFTAKRLFDRQPNNQSAQVTEFACRPRRCDGSGGDEQDSNIFQWNQSCGDVGRAMSRLGELRPRFLMSEVWSTLSAHPLRRDRLRSLLQIGLGRFARSIDPWQARVSRHEAAPDGGLDPPSTRSRSASLGAGVTTA